MPRTSETAFPGAAAAPRGFRSLPHSFLDQLVHPHEDAVGDLDAESLCGLEVDNEVKLQGGLNRNVRRLSPAQHLMANPRTLSPKEPPRRTIDCQHSLLRKALLVSHSRELDVIRHGDHRIDGPGDLPLAEMEEGVIFARPHGFHNRADLFRGPHVFFYERHTERLRRIPENHDGIL